jgi:chromosome partitioning protein
VLDADASNNSLSFYLDESITGDSATVVVTQGQTIFNLFMRSKAYDCITTISDNLDLIRGDVRLNEFRSTDSLKRLKRSLTSLDYDYCIIDTSPTYDNIIGNVLTASGVLLIPIQRDIFSYQALKYQFEKLADLELDNFDTHIIFNQFEKPMTDNQGAYRNQITNMFLDDAVFAPFINLNRLSRSSVYRKYINRRNYQLTNKEETRKSLAEVKALVKSILDIEIQEAL